MRKLVSAVMAAALLVGLGFTMQGAQAAAPPCQGQGTNYTGTVIVPSGTTCNLQGSTITGNVFVQPGGRLVSGGGNHITGNVYSTQAGSDTANLLGGGPFSFSVVMCNSIVDGNVTISGSTDHVLIGDDTCGSNRIARNVTLSDNKAGVILDNDPTNCPIGSCAIGGAVSVTNNSGTTLDDPQSAEVSANVIGGSLYCAGNANGVTNDGLVNTAPTKAGQCATL